jgi:uncharacterized flavoprotein (TIGR03862 family)
MDAIADDGDAAGPRDPQPGARDQGRATVAVVGAGPAGLMAAEVLAQAGHAVQVYDGMASAGRKFLLAGRGGLNLTHSEPFDRFASRYGGRSAEVTVWLRAFGPQAVRDWAQGLGTATFVGTSGRVFPQDMKAAPLLRGWLHRLRDAGVQFHMRHRFVGWTAAGDLRFATPSGEQAASAAAAVLALGGASWSRLGSDGAWVPLLRQRGVDVAELLPANCGFDVRGGWSDYFAARFAGQPFKTVAIRFGSFQRVGEFVATATGVEGSLVYAASALLRDEIRARGSACFELDLLPGRSLEQVRREVAHPRGSRSLSSHLKGRLGLEGIKLALLHELSTHEALHDPVRLAAAIKQLPVTVVRTRPIDEAISTAGGVRLEELDGHLMLRTLPGVFCAGEMLDWEAPTGGYLLTACLASGRVAGHGAARFIAARQNLVR